MPRCRRSKCIRHEPHRRTSGRIRARAPVESIGFIAAVAGPRAGAGPARSVVGVAGDRPVAGWYRAVQPDVAGVGNARAGAASGSVSQKRFCARKLLRFTGLPADAGESRAVLLTPFYSILLRIPRLHQDCDRAALGVRGVVRNRRISGDARLLARYDVRTVLLASFGLASARWLLIGFFPQDVALIIPGQVLHAATFGSFHAAGIQMVYRFFTGRH